MGFDALVGDLVNLESVQEVKDQLGDSLDGVAQQEQEEQLESKTDEVSEEEVEENEEEKPVKRSRLDERIQQLVNKNNEVEAIARATEYRLQRQLEQERLEYDNRAKQERLETARQIDELKTLLLSRDNNSEKQIDPLTSFQRETLTQAEAIADKKVQKALQEVENLKRVYEQQQAEQERARRHLMFDNMTNQALEKMLVNFDEKDKTNLYPALTELMSVYAAATGTYPEQALPNFQKLLDQYVDAKVKIRARSKGEAVKKSLEAPKAATARSTATTNTTLGLPSDKEIQKAGGSLLRAFLDKAKETAAKQ